MSFWNCVLCALKGCFRGEKRSDENKCPQIPPKSPMAMNRLSLPRRTAMLCHEKQVRWAASYLSNSDSATTEAQSSAHSKQRYDALVPPSRMSTTDRFFVCHFIFGQPTASFVPAHPYMENPPCEEGFRRSFSSGAERAGAFVLGGASAGDWGRREDKQGDASTVNQHRRREQNGAAAEPWMLGGRADFSIIIIVSHVTTRCGALMMKHEKLWIQI